MMILIGLGNPGKKYASTRHNAGKILAAYLRQHQVEGLEVLETDCYMNRSGEFVKRIIQNTRKTRIAGNSEIQTVRKPDIPALRFSDSLRISGSPSILSFPKLIIAHDDLDLKLGEWKIHFGRGPRLHQGILSIEQALGTKEFWRVRIGVDNRKSRLPSAEISQHPPAIAFPARHASQVEAGGGDSRWRTGQIADKSDRSDSGLSDLSIIRLSADAGRSKPAFSVSGQDYVLQPFKREETIILSRTFGFIKRALLEQFTKSVRSAVDSKVINYQN